MRERKCRMIELIYEAGGKRIDTLSSDDNMVLKSRYSRGHRYVTVTAINKIKLVRATDEVPKDFYKDDLIMPESDKSIRQ